MTRNTFFAVTVTACTLAFPLGAAAQSAGAPTPGQAPARSARMSASATKAGQASTAASSFLKSAGQDGQAEVALAQLAEERASRADVKSFASHLQEDHQKANGEVMSLAQSKNVTLPSDLSAMQKAAKDRLSKLSGAAFDRAYLAEMVSDHNKAIALFTKAGSSTDADIKAFATKTLPTLKSHLEQAQSLQKTASSK
jgi:putative membrane protein